MAIQVDENEMKIEIDYNLNYDGLMTNILNKISKIRTFICFVINILFLILPHC